MNKLVEAFNALQELEGMVKGTLFKVKENYNSISICYHNHYDVPTISIFRTHDGTCTILNQNGISYHIEIGINEELADKIISNIEKAFNEN